MLSRSSPSLSTLNPLQFAVLAFLLSLTLTAQEFRWGTRSGGAGQDFIRCLRVDSVGNLRVFGAFTGSANIAGTTVDSGLEDGAFVASLTSAGNLLWVRKITSTTGIFPNGIEVDGLGNVFVAAGFTGTLNFGSSTLSGGRAFIAKYDVNGNLVWTRRFGFTASRVALDAAGNSFVSGSSNVTNTVDGVTVAPFAVYDYFTAKFSGSGALQWVRRRGGSSLGAVGQQAAGAAADSAGNSYLAAVMQGSVKFGEENPIEVTNPEVFLAKSDPNGNMLWMRRFTGGVVSLSGSTGLGNERGCAVDSQGNVYLVANLRGSATIGATTLSNPSTLGLAIVKYNANGDPLWARQTVGANSNRARNIAVDQNQNVYLTGKFDGTVRFGTNTLTATGNSDLFLTKLDAAGNFLWALKSSGSNDIAGMDVDINECGIVYISGSLLGQKQLGATTLNSAGDLDGFIAQIKGDSIPAGTISLSFLTTGAALNLSWPKSSAGCFKLQSATSLTPVAWTDVLQAPLVIADRLELTRARSANAELFRLAEQ